MPSVAVGKETCDMGDQVQRSFWRSIAKLLLCSLGVAVGLIYEYSEGHLSPRQLGTGFLMLVACLFGLSVFRLTRNEILKSTPSGEDKKGPSETALAIRRLRTIVLTLPAVLVVASWMTRNQPLLPRVIGAAINILLTCWFVFLLFRAKRNVN